MVKSALSFYALKDESLRSHIISLLSLNKLQSVNELHRAIKDEFKIDVSYQAVHKTIKQLLKNGCVAMDNRKYQINEEWVKEMGRIVQQLETGQGGKLSVAKTLLNKQNCHLNHQKRNIESFERCTKTT